MTLTSAEWVERYAEALVLAPPSDAERDALLDLAGVDPADALALARRLVEQTGRGGEAG